MALAPCLPVARESRRRRHRLHTRDAPASKRDLTAIDIAGLVARADVCRRRWRRFGCVFWLWRFFRSCRCRRPGRPMPRNMIRPFRSACMSSSGAEARMRIAATTRWPNAGPRPPASASPAIPTRIMRAQPPRRDDMTGGIAASIELSGSMRMRPSPSPAPSRCCLVETHRPGRGGRSG